VSLLTFSVDGSTVTVHRLVMRVIRESLASDDSLVTVSQATGRILDGLAESLNKNSHEDRTVARDLVEQIMALDESAARCPPGSGLDHLMIMLRWWAGSFLNWLGDNATQVVEIAKRLLTDHEQRLGPDHPDTLSSRSNLALAYRDAGRISEAITMHEQILAVRERTLGPDHRDTLRSRHGLVDSFAAAGRASEAITLYKRTLADQERILGPDHPDTWRLRNDLACAYADTGCTDEAITLHEQTLAGFERTLGPDHSYTSRSRRSLVRAYRAAGREEDARRLES
jgi:tetratricopeptide (TPR) repeat protein